MGRPKKQTDALRFFIYSLFFPQKNYAIHPEISIGKIGKQIGRPDDREECLAFADRSIIVVIPDYLAKLRWEPPFHRHVIAYLLMVYAKPGALLAHRSLRLPLQPLIKCR